MSERNRPAREPQAEADGVIEGRNAVTEALRTGTVIDKIFILKGETDSSLGHIASTARARGIVVVDADKRKLDRMSVTHAHQGVIALCAVREYASVDDILAAAREKGEAPLIVVCDELSDPHNLGAVMRSALLCGAHGIVIPKRGGASVTPTVIKSSAGAAERLPVARVANIGETIRRLKDQGVFVYCADMDGVPLRKNNLTGPIALVLGSEGSGVSQLVKKLCDGVVRLDMAAQGTGVDSFNVSVAAGIILYEIQSQRAGE